MKTAGVLLTEEQYLAMLAQNQAEKEAAIAKTAANKQKKLDRERQKIIEEHAKQVAQANQLAKEATVRDLLKAQGFWTSSTQFIKGQDMKDFLKAIKAHKHLVAALDGFSTSLKLADAFTFLSNVVDTYPSESWPKA